MNILEEFDYRCGPLEGLDYREASDRLRAFRAWFLATPETKAIHDQLYAQLNAVILFKPSAGRVGRMTIAASTPEEIAYVGFDFIKMLVEKTMSAAALPGEYNIRPSFQTTSVQAHFDELMRRYIKPAIDFLRRELEKSEVEESSHLSTVNAPVETSESLARFRQDHPNAGQTAFIMMRFGKTPAHEQIVAAIRESLAQAGIVALRADDKEYHDDLFMNVVTYMCGCTFGIAVFERIEVEHFNPNVALEVGYMQALRKPVCLLKDQTLTTLPADLMGKLYRSFDPLSPAKTIPGELEKWLRDKALAQ